MSEHPNATRAREGFERFFQVVAVYRAVGERQDGRELDIEQALLVELEDGRWKAVRAQPLDRAAFDAFCCDDFRHA